MKEPKLCSVGEQVVERELDQLTADEIAGAWRGLCAMMLLRTVSICGKGKSSLLARKQHCLQRKTAEKWLAGEKSLITFSDVLIALDMDESYVIRGLELYASDLDHRSRIKVAAKKRGLCYV